MLLQLGPVLCLVMLVVSAAEAQYQPNDFDVPDGRIEKAGNRLMVSTKEVSHLGNGEVRSQFGGTFFPTRKSLFRLSAIQASGHMKIVSTTVTSTTFNR